MHDQSSAKHLKQEFPFLPHSISEHRIADLKHLGEVLVNIYPSGL